MLSGLMAKPSLLFTNEKRRSSNPWCFEGTWNLPFLDLNSYIAVDFSDLCNISNLSSRLGNMGMFPQSFSSGSEIATLCFIVVRTKKIRYNKKQGRLYTVSTVSCFIWDLEHGFPEPFANLNRRTTTAMRRIFYCAHRQAHNLIGEETWSLPKGRI